MTVQDYTPVAETYAAIRSPEIGIPEVDALVAALPTAARVLDLGCGDGRPLAIRLAEHGCRVIGVDACAPLLERFRAAVPTAEAVLADLSTWTGCGAVDGILCWGVLFHFAPEEQRAMLRRWCAWLRPGGLLLFTSGRTAGEATGSVADLRLDHWSLDEADYLRICADAGLQGLPLVDDRWGNPVYRFRRPPSVVDAAARRSPSA